MNETKDISKLYIETKAGPAELATYRYPERAIVNAVAIVTEQSWEDTVRSMIEQVHLRCNMPSHCMSRSDFLRANGFVPVSCPDSLRSLLAELDASGEDKKYIVRISHGYMAVVKDSVSGSYVFKGPYSRERLFRYYVTDMYMGEVWLYIPGTDNRSEIIRAKSNKHHTEENSRLAVKNVNPEDKYAGDCVIRALAGAYDCSWHEAVDHIAEATRYSDPVLNSTDNTLKTLWSLGFEGHKALRRDGKLLSGKQFCEMMDQTYFNGERIFVFVGKSHCVAVVPYAQDDASMQYVVQDTWDCTERKFWDYFVYKEKKQYQAYCTDNEYESFRYEKGATIKHPSYGTGKIVDIRDNTADRILCVEFESHGIKMLSEKWLIKKGL